jgi:hypothetical protein
MLAIIKTINGVKKIIPVTADVGAGNPVGTIIVVCSNQIPSNYLPLGTQFDITLYPVLYALLGTDTTPTASALGLPTLSSGQYAIKATSGLSENAQDNVLATFNENNSYSTSEINTGKKWIDGKPIYRKVFNALITSTSMDVAHSISNVDKVVNVQGFSETNGGNTPSGFYASTSYFFSLSGDRTQLHIRTTNAYINTAYNCILEYTKTTD